MLHYQSYTPTIFFTHKRNTYGLPDSSGVAAVLKFNSFSQLCSYIDELSQHLCTTDYELTLIVITKYTETDANGKSCQNFSPKTNQYKYENISNSSDTKSKTDRNICTKNSSWQNEHSTTAIKTNDNIFLQKPLDNTNITQAEILKTITDKYDTKRTEIIETDEIKLQEQTENIEKSKENTSKNIAQVAKETTSNSEPIANILEQKNENMSESKIILNSNDILGKILNMKTTIEHDYIPNFEKSKENVIQENERRNNTNINQIQNTTTSNHSTVERNDIKTKYHNLRKRKLDNEQINNTPTKKIRKEKQNVQNHNCNKLEQSRNKIIPLSHMIILKNEKRNKQTYTTIEKDNKLCKKYGYKLTKLCTVCMNDITQTLAILNAKIKVQSKTQKYY